MHSPVPTFISKMNIALKEANEAGYWLSLMKDSGYITPDTSDSLEQEAKELQTGQLQRFNM